MSFDLPWHFCAVTEKGLKFANFAAETYDPRNWGATGADASFEAGMDKEGRFSRVWIEHQSAARIVVRVRYALTNSKYEFAHDDMKTDSPYNGGPFTERRRGQLQHVYVRPGSTGLHHPAKGIRRRETQIHARCNLRRRIPPRHDVARQSSLRCPQLE